MWFKSGGRPGIIFLISLVSRLNTALIDSGKGDEGTRFNKWCSDFVATDGTPVERDLGDGEKNTAFVDMDGKWTADGQPAYLMPKELTTMNTGCYNNEESVGLLEPFGKVCPIDIASATLAVTTVTDGYTSQGHRLEIKNNNGEYDPMVLHTNSQDMTGKVHE